MIIFNDLHLADRPPLGRADDYAAEGLAMLEELVELACERKARLVTTGDLFHIKRPQHVSHRLVRVVIEILSALPEPLLVVPGNHDMTERGMESLDHQPLGVLFESGCAERLVLEATHGWVLVGREYDMERDADPTYYELEPEERKIIGSSDLPVIMVAHGSIIPPGEVRPYPTVRCDQIDLTGINVLCSGHIHEDLGIFPMQEAPKQPIHIFANVGSLGRVSRTEANMTRTVKALSVRFDGRKGVVLEELPLKSARPAGEIFLADVEDVPSDEIAAFVARLAQGDVALANLSFKEVVAKLGLPVRIQGYCLRYLEEAEGAV